MPQTLVVQLAGILVLYLSQQKHGRLRNNCSAISSDVIADAMSVIDSVACDMFICDGKYICLSPLFEAFWLYRPVMYCSSYSNADDDNNNFSSIFVLWPSFPQLIQFRMIAPWELFGLVQQFFINKIQFLSYSQQC